MQTALSYRTNRDLFSNHYLDKHLPETEAWDELSDDELREAKDDIMELWDREKETAPKRNESQLEEKFIRPMFRKLGIPFEVEESTSRTQRRPDYGFFASKDAARDAFDRREDGNDFYRDAVAVADAKRWGRPLDTRGSGEHERDFENPSYQIHVYLQEVDDADWAVLTDGKKWRLYYSPTSHRLDSYYEIDLPTVLEKGDLEDFKYFYLFFRHGAFLEDTTGECFLDEVYDESNVFAQELGADLQDNIYEAIKILSEGFMQYPDNDLSEEDLDRIHDSSLIYLYRLIFVLYAESEGRDLLDTNNEIYEESYSLNTLKQDVAEELDSTSPKYRDWQDNLWDRLDELFKLIDQGSKSRGIPEEDLYIPAYNGGLFRTDPGEDDSDEAQFIASHQVGDTYLARVIELLTRSQNGNGGGNIFVDYSSLDVRHLGSIYEGLLEYQLDVADEPLALEDGEYVSASEDDDVVVQEGEVYLTTGSGERKATGSYYTPEYVVEYIVDETLGPLVQDCRQNALDKRGSYGGLAQAFADEVFDLKILDPAMGSGHFLTSAIDYLAREIIDAQEKQAAQQGIETVDEEHDINWARRQVAQRCIYGVDLNPLAVELAKVSLWLRTLATEQPLAFLNHHLKTGNSLVGSDIEEIEELESDASGGGQNATLADFGVARKGTIEQLMRIYQDFIAIENQELADVKQMEAKYDEFEQNKLRQRLEAMANVHTAEEFGLTNVPGDAYERMAAALEDDEWAQIKNTRWFQDAQTWAERDQYFHWRLEYPEVFYNEDGSERGESGFDTIIGNPPYGKEISESKKDYYDSTFSHQEYQLDRYLLFIEQCVRLTISAGKVGLIIPNTWLTNLKFGRMRKLMFSETTIHSVARYEQNVFPEATVEPISIILSNQGAEYNTIRVREKSYNETLSEFEIEQGLFQNNYDSSVNIFSGAATRSIEQKFTKCLKLNDVSDIYNGVKPFEKGKGNPPQTEEIVEKKPYVSDKKEDDSFKPLLRGSLIERYLIKWNSDSWISYGEWLAAPRDSSIFDVDNKILIRQTGDSLISALDERQFIARDNLHIVIPEEGNNIRFLLAIINSNFANWYYQEIINPEKGEALAQVKKGHLARVPVPSLNSKFVGSKLSFSMEDKIPENIEDCMDIISEAEIGTTKQMYNYIILLAECSRLLKQEWNKMNLDLMDYLVEYAEGPQLSELDYIPAQDISDSIITETTESKNNLRTGNIKLIREQNDVTLSISARYKPPDETNKETDRWGYTETDFREVFTLTNLSDTEADLVQAFVPIAVSKASGFANFRENATKTNSLVDRIMEITLPEPTDIASDLQRYLEIEDRANNLDAKIETANALIDQAMYDLYGLTEEEIDVVESDTEK